VKLGFDHCSSNKNVCLPINPLEMSAKLIYP